MATSPIAEWPEDALEVGRIGEAWGLKGDFRVLAYAEPPLALIAARRWYLRPPEDTVRIAPRGIKPPPTLAIRAVRAQGDGYVAASPDVVDRDAAEALRGARIFIARDDFPEPDADEFYWADLIGLAVVNREAVALGTVVGLIDTGPHSVIRTRLEGEAEERLIPFVSAYVDSVDLKARRIVVDWGLDY